MVYEDEFLGSFTSEEEEVPEEGETPEPDVKEAPEVPGESDDEDLEEDLPE